MGKELGAFGLSFIQLTPPLGHSQRSRYSQLLNPLLLMADMAAAGGKSRIVTVKSNYGLSQVTMG
jgi:hypothetical protein